LTAGPPRARYDAARAVEVFGVRLRDEVDLDTLSAELLTIVGQTVQPTQRPCGCDPEHEVAAPSPTSNNTNAA